MGFQLQQWVVGRWGLQLEDIQTSTKQVAAAQGFKQGFLVNDAASRDIDEDGILLHQCQLSSANHVMAFSTQWQMQGQYINLRQHVVQ